MEAHAIVETAAGQQEQQQQLGNIIWDALPAAVVADILHIRVGNPSVVACSCTCRAWRSAVQTVIQALAPRSVQAMPFVGGCSSLRSLALGQALPAKPFGPFTGFNRIAALSGLTQLCLAVSNTATWSGKAAVVTAADLACISALTALQALDLSHQPLLADGAALKPLSNLGQLRSLQISLAGCSWQLPYETWRNAVATLTALTSLGLSGCSQAVAECATASCAAEGEDGGAVPVGAGQHGVLVPAPLQLLSGLVQLQQLDMSEWHFAAPLTEGFVAIGQLPRLSALDLSGWAPQPHQQISLLSLLQSPAEQPQRHQQQQQQPVAPSCWSSHASGTSSSSAAQLFAGLQRLRCVRAVMAFPEACWSLLPLLAQLDLSHVKGFRGMGLPRLQQLQMLVLQGCQQLDYDVMCDVMTSCSRLQHLDLQQATIILQGAGSTGRRLQEGSYFSPGSAAGAAARAGTTTAAAGIAAARQHFGLRPSSSSSRRDAAGSCASAGDHAAGFSRLSTQPCEPQPPSAAAAAGGLRVLLMSECGLAIEGLAWHRLPHAPGAPADPSQLLFDLLMLHWQGFFQQQQRRPLLRVLHWAHCSSGLVQSLLSRLVAGCHGSLQELVLTGSNLPDEPSRCWTGLAAAVSLTRLDLSEVSFSRRGFAQPCGNNPTVALLSAVAGMRGLKALGLGGWRFYFATLHPLAVLGGILVALDLGGARDLVDATLWSLTHLTGLTRLSLSRASPSNDQIFGLLFLHLSALRDLDLSACNNFSSHSAASLTRLTSLTSLDLRGTRALLADDVAAVTSSLASLPCLRRLALTPHAAPAAAGVDSRGVIAQSAGRIQGGGQPQGGAAAGEAPAPHQHAYRLAWQYKQQAGSSSTEDCSDAISSGGISRRSSCGRGGDRGGCSGMEDYAYLAGLAQCTSLRQLVVAGVGPAVADYCRSILPFGVDVR